MISALTLSGGSMLPGLRMAPSVESAMQPTTASDNDFGSVLKNLAFDTMQTVREGEAAAIAGVQGSMPLQTVVEHVMAAERTLQAGITVRDKFVSSYLEITRMQI